MANAKESHKNLPRMDELFWIWSSYLSVTFLRYSHEFQINARIILAQGQVCGCRTEDGLSRSSNSGFESQFLTLTARSCFEFFKGRYRSRWLWSWLHCHCLLFERFILFSNDVNMYSAFIHYSKLRLIQRFDNSGQSRFYKWFLAFS